MPIPLFVVGAVVVWAAVNEQNVECFLNGPRPRKPIMIGII